MIGRTTLLLAALLCAAPVHAASAGKNCLDVALRTPGSPDGEYLIEPVPGQPFKVWCQGMSTWFPQEYLTLVRTGGNFNYSQYTAGGAAPGTNVRTSFTKVRIDPNTLAIDIGDLAFATTTGLLSHPPGLNVTATPYGVASDCLVEGSQSGAANIDLTGTPFKVRSLFLAHGHMPAGTVVADGRTTLLVPNQLSGTIQARVLQISGGGYCGGAGPYGFQSSHASWLFPQPGLLALKLVYAGY